MATQDVAVENWLQLAADQAYDHLRQIPIDQLGPAGRILMRALGEHVQSEFDCALCEDEGIVAKDFGLDSEGAPAIVPCPDCQGPATMNTFYERRHAFLAGISGYLRGHLMDIEHTSLRSHECGALGMKAREAADILRAYADSLDHTSVHLRIREVMEAEEARRGAA